MLKIERIYNAAVGAIRDRRFITKAANRNLDKDEVILYNILKNTSGPSTNNPIQMVKSWKKAYNANTLRLLKIEALNAPFKTQSGFSKLVDKVSKFLRNS